MRVHNGKITDHWGVVNLLSLVQQIGGWVPAVEMQARNSERFGLEAQI
jgi:hypothetical protein